MTIRVRCEQLGRTWPVPGKEPVVAVRDLDLAVSAGEVFGLLGPNGAGKTTTLRMLATLTAPSQGRAEVAGFDVVAAPREVRASIGYLSTTSGVPAALTGRECLVAFARLHGLTDASARAAAAIARFRMEPYADRRVDTLSSGQRQRVRVACATVHDPPVWLLDEPTANLDVLASEDLLDAVRAARDGGAAVLYSTHDLAEAARICDRIGIIVSGRLLAVGTPDELTARAGTVDLHAAFLALVKQAGAGP